MSCEGGDPDGDHEPLNLEVVLRRDSSSYLYLTEVELSEYESANEAQHNESRDIEEEEEEEDDDDEEVS